VTSYVALGSSFTAGPGVDPIIVPGCGRSGRNYPNLVAERLGYDLVDVTSGGQLDAVGPDADLVTVTSGGNDVEYLLTLLRCSYRADPAGAPAAAGAFFGTPIDPAAVGAALAGLPTRMAGLVDAVRARAPRARVVLVDHLTVVPGQATAAFGMSEEHRELCAGIGRRLEAATARPRAGRAPSW
jgi:hypothetical protein